MGWWSTLTGGLALGQASSAPKSLQTSNIKWQPPEKLSTQVTSGHTCPVPTSSTSCPPAPTVCVRRQRVSRRPQVRPRLDPALSSCLCLRPLRARQIFWDLQEHVPGAAVQTTGRMGNIRPGVGRQDAAPRAGKTSSLPAPACLAASGVHCSPSYHHGKGARAQEETETSGYVSSLPPSLVLHLHYVPH